MRISLMKFSFTLPPAVTMAFVQPGRLFIAMNIRIIRIMAGLLADAASLGTAQEPVTPKEPIKLFNGKNLDRLTTWVNMIPAA